MIRTQHFSNAIPGDIRMEFKALFEEAFDVLLTTYDVHVHNGMAPVGAHGSDYLYERLSNDKYDVKITCCFVTQPPKQYDMLEWFDMRQYGHALYQVRYNHESHVNMLDLLYSTNDIERFMADLKNVKFRRFSNDVDKKLETILDDGTEER